MFSVQGHTPYRQIQVSEVAEFRSAGAGRGDTSGRRKKRKTQCAAAAGQEVKENELGDSPPATQPSPAETPEKPKQATGQLQTQATESPEEQKTPQQKADPNQQQSTLDGAQGSLTSMVPGLIHLDT